MIGIGIRIKHKRSGGYPDVVTNGGFDADSDWTKGAGWTIAGGKAVATAATTDLYQGCLTVGKTYRTSYTISDYSSGSIRLRCGGGDAGVVKSANGTYERDVVCSGNIYIIIDGITAFTGKIDNVSALQLD